MTKDAKGKKGNLPAHNKVDITVPNEVKDLRPIKTELDGQLKTYLKEISRYKLLSPEQEAELTKTLSDTGDIEIARKLVLANLRLVVKIAMEYRSAYQNVMDLIQEGNIGLMRAVSKYDPTKGAKLSYYASWWIKSYILKFILDNFRLVKVGTTNEQKKLFYNLVKEQNRLESMGISPSVKQIADNLGVREVAVEEMQARLGPQSGEVALDMPSTRDSHLTLGEALVDPDEVDIDDALGNKQELAILREHLGDFVSGLNERDQRIFEDRLLSEIPPSLQKLADEYGVSRERIRQIEERLIKKLKVYMSEYIR